MLLLVFFPLAAEAQLWLARDTISARDIITLVFSGDVMQHDPQIQGAWDEEKGDYDYMPCFQYIRPYWEEADVVIANLETTLSDRGFSGYPQFCAPWQLARDLRESGVDILTTNNNHSCDKGGKGVQRTLHYLDSLGMPHTGTYADTAAWIAGSPLYIRHGQFKIALLSYTYGTNGLPPGKGQVVGMIDTFHIARQIEKARLDTATNIIAFIQMLDQVVPGFASDETLLYSPELKFYSNRVKMDEDLVTNVAGLHCLGDSCGWTRGLMMASVMGVLMGRKIAQWDAE